MSSIPPAIPPLKAGLLCRIRPGFTERFAVPAAESVMGREPGLAVTIPIDGVSRRHARIAFDGRSYWIENLSPAGTFLNGVLVEKERLAHLDVVTLGRNVDLLFVLRREEQAAAATVDGIVRAALLPEALDSVPYEIAPGEILMGRSTANNVVAEASGAVSKIHARIERTPQQLILRDLGSSNGTFVNGERVMTALLADGDLISLANVVRYRVVVERGAVAAPGASAAAAPPPASEMETRLQFSPDWKTRYDWDSGEIKDIAALQARLIDEDLERKRAKAKREAPTEKAGALAAVKPAAAKTPPRPNMTVPMPVVPADAIAAADAAEAGKDDASALKAAADALAAQAAKIARPQAVAADRVTAIRFTGPAGELEVREPGEYVVGRAKDAPLRVDHPTISRRHALVVLSVEGEAFLDDAGGANGTRLNGLLVRKRSRMSDGDRISIGAVDLMVRLTRAASGPSR